MALKNIVPGAKRTPHSDYEIERDTDIWDINSRIDKIRCTMFGRPCSQTYTAFFVWEKLLGPLDFARFIEVGTGYGNTSIFFMLHCVQKDALFVTHDRMANRVNNSSPLKQWLDLKECSVLGDVYGPAISQTLMELIRQPGRTVMFLDGGDKPHEFRLFVPALKKDDIVAVHDWGRAIKQEWIQPMIDMKRLRPVMLEDNRSLHTLTRMWRVGK